MKWLLYASIIGLLISIGIAFWFSRGNDDDFDA